MRKFVASISLAMATVLALPAVAFAHVVVTPDQAGVGARTLFNVSVPNEKEVDVTGLRLTIPAGMEGVMPTVHPGWTITTTTDANKNVTEIKWEGGTIPTGQRDDFTFKGMTPADETDLIWKAYQTYADGTTVAWDQKPTDEHSESEDSTSGPYSVTKVTNDLDTAFDNQESNSGSSGLSTSLALVASLIALALSVFAVVKQRK